MNIQVVVAFLTLLTQIVIVVGLLAYIFHNNSRKLIKKYVGEFGYLIAFFVALFSVLISLYFSEVVGWQACVLCWYQRIAMYPLVVVFAIGVLKQDKVSKIHGMTLSIIGFIIAIYQIYLQVASLAGATLSGFCSAVGATDCSEIYLREFGYITFPVMAATAFLSIILIMLARSRDTIEI